MIEKEQSSILQGKKEIMEYLDMGEDALDNAIANLGFPYFRIGQRICSHSRAIDEWAYSMSMARVGNDEDASAQQL